MAFLENIQLACAVCKIGVFTLFRKICCIKSAPPKPEFTAICLGLSNAGKTTLLTNLSGDRSEEAIGPTKGFLIKAVIFSNCILNLKEVGGGENVRPYWKHYYKGMEGIVFIVNCASSEDELDDARDALHDVLETLKRLPCLILGNCSDLPGARTAEQLTEALELEEACRGRPWEVHICNSHDTAMIREGFEKFNKHFFLADPDMASNRI